jgi:thiosulfate/3-mercaptopyruvate sulfurtransferase
MTPLIDADWIADHLDDPTVRTVEIDVSRVAYDQGHIPGAVLWNAYADLRHADYSPIGRAELEQLLSNSGLTPETTVICYGYGAHLGYWLMKSHGHDRVVLMDGSRDRWKGEWSVETPSSSRSSYALSSEESPICSSLESVRAGGAGRITLDVRSRAEYDGDCFWPSGATEDAGRAGHIPGSVHLPIEELRTEDGRFRDPDEMRNVLRDHGVTPDRRVVTYCTIGNRASQAWFALTHVLDHADASVYYGSWAEWGTQPGTEVERVMGPAASGRRSG